MVEATVIARFPFGVDALTGAADGAAAGFDDAHDGAAGFDGATDGSGAGFDGATDGSGAGLVEATVIARFPFGGKDGGGPLGR